MPTVNPADFEKNTWTPEIAAAWSGVPLRSLYRLLREHQVPCIPMGDKQVQKLEKARDGKRKRACFKYVIPRVAFIRWFENISKPEPEKSRQETIDQTAA